MQVAIIAGEVSGELIGADLARALRALRPDIRIWGTGSGAMAGAGVELIADSASWSSIGVVQALKQYPRLLASVRPHVWGELRRRRPNVVVPIDFGYFNVRMAGYSRSLGLKVAYYMPPGSWRRKGHISGRLRTCADMFLVPFSFSAARYEATALTRYVGHPLLDRLSRAMSREQYCSTYGLDPAHLIFALLPGTRSHELEHNLPAMLEAAVHIHRAQPGAQFVIGSASPRATSRIHGIVSSHAARSRPPASADTVRDRHAGATDPVLVTPEGVTLRGQPWTVRARGTMTAEPPPVVVVEGRSVDVLTHADAAVCCSGTVTLEAAALATPTVVIYRISPLMEIEARVRGMGRRRPTISLPNLIAGRTVVPELLQDEASPERIADAALAFVQEPPVRADCLAGLAEVRSTLGEAGASHRAAEAILELAAND